MSKILIVDDISSIREALKEHLYKDFIVLDAENPKEAIKICETEKIDLLITDIQMPESSGIDLILILRQKYPKLECVLMTAYNIDEYVSTLRKVKIYNIIPKSVLTDIKFIKSICFKLLCKDPFGIYYYFPKIKAINLPIAELHRMHKNKDQSLEKDNYYTCHISSIEENRTISQKVYELLASEGSPNHTQQVIEELCTNAVKYALNDRALESSHKETHCFDLSFGILDGNTVIQVLDYNGNLTRDQILEHLERQVTIDRESGLPIGLEDSHGRGLYISREQCQYLIFNLSPNLKTEIIAIIASKEIQGAKGVFLFQKK